MRPYPLTLTSRQLLGFFLLELGCGRGACGSFLARRSLDLLPFNLSSTFLVFAIFSLSTFFPAGQILHQLFHAESANCTVISHPSNRLLRGGRPRLAIFRMAHTWPCKPRPPRSPGISSLARLLLLLREVKTAHVVQRTALVERKPWAGSRMRTLVFVLEL